MNIKEKRQELKVPKKINEMNLRVVDYERVSTNKKSQKTSIINQQNYFQDLYKENQHWIYKKSYIDIGKSGTKIDKRTQFKKMLEDAKNHKFDLILVKEISRFSRNIEDFINIIEKLTTYGVVVFFISENINTLEKDSELRLKIILSIAQNEVETIKKRIKFGIKRSQKENKIMGGNIYGYNKENGILKINSKEKIIVNEIFNMYISRKYNINDIKKYLTQKQIYTKNNKQFSINEIKHIIKNPKYKGYYANQTKSINIPKIVTENKWNYANKILLNNIKKEDKYKNKIYCAKDNYPYIKHKSTNNTTTYVCKKYLEKGLKGCNNNKIKEKDLDNILKKILLNKINTKELENELKKDYLKLINNKTEKLILKKLNKEIVIENNHLKEIKKLKGLIKNNDYKTKYNEIETKLKKLIIKKQLITKNKTYQNYLNNCIEEELSITKNIEIFINIYIKKILINNKNNDKNKIKISILFNSNL